MRFARALVVAGVLLAPLTPTRAQALTVAEVIEYCSAEEYSSRWYVCMGYISGVADAHVSNNMDCHLTGKLGEMMTIVLSQLVELVIRASRVTPPAASRRRRST